MSLKKISSCSTEKVEVTWTLKQFEMLALRSKKSSTPEILGNFDLRLNPKQSSQGACVPIEGRVTARCLNAGSKHGKSLGLHLNLVDKDKCPMRELFVDFTCYLLNKGEDLLDDDVEEDEEFHGVEVKKSFSGDLLRAGRIGSDNFAAMVFARKWVDNEGSLEFRFKITVDLSGKELVGNPHVELNFDNYARKASEDFMKLLGDQGTSDVKIKVTRGQEKSFYCHQALLSARSRVFRAMFESDLKEKKERLVEVDDISGDAMGEFINFVYCGRFSDTQESRSEVGAASLVPSWVAVLPELVYAADKYELKDLMEFCDGHLRRAFSVNNAKEMCQLIKRHGLSQARAHFQTFVSANPELMFKILD